MLKDIRFIINSKIANSIRRMELPKVNYIESFIGGGLLVGAGYFSIKTYRVARYLFKNYQNLHNSNVDLKALMKKPNREQHLILHNLKCVPSPELFKQHMTYIDRKEITGTKEFCFKQPCSSFAAQITIKNEKYDIFCDCSTFDPFVASPLLINNYDLNKKIGKKQKLAMISYGCIKYDKDQKRFNFQGHCFGTTLEQIEWAWGKILQHKIFVYLIEGIGLGVGFSLLYNNYLRWEAEQERGRHQLL